MSDTHRTKIDWYYDNDGERDGKKSFKPNSTYKYINKRRRKAKEKQSLIRDIENPVEFPKTDQYDWL